MSLEVNQMSPEGSVEAKLETRQTSMAGFLLALFATLEEKQISYCLLRDGEQFDKLANSTEVDLLVAEEQLDQLQDVLASLDFVRLPNWGHAPHHFFLTYNEDADRWLKLDVVTNISYGKPVRALHTALAAGCLERRRCCGPTYIPAAEDELVTLLLHCVLDKGRFDPARRRRLQTLSRENVDREYLSSLLASYWLPSMSWTQLGGLIDRGEWATLLAQEKDLVAQLTGRDRLGTVGRRLRDRVLRKLNRWAGFWQLRVPMVALLAPDGAGKTTLASGIKETSYFPVRSIYMGLYQNEKSKSKRFQIPGLGLMGRILTQWRRYLRGRYHQGRARLVIFDRYTYDALLSPRRPLDVLRRFRRWLLANACPAPDLVIMLDAPGRLLYARKGEHTAAILEEQRQEYLQLRSQLPQIMVVDASQNSDCVRREVMSLIWRRLNEQQTTKGASR